MAYLVVAVVLLRRSLASAQLELASLRAAAPAGAAAPGLAGVEIIRLRSKVPPPGDDLVGREGERVQIETALRGQRLVTLTGTSGVGKTSLALDVARSRAASGSETVCFVDLARASYDRPVVTILADALDVRAVQGRTLLDTLVEALSQQDVLLVLDGCEHVRTAAAITVRRLLDDCECVHILATSQQRLGLTEEREVKISPFDVPPADTIPFEKAEGLDAVELFVARAKRVDPDFRLDRDNYATILEICRRQGGLPLAVTIAAAQLGSFSLSDVLGAIDQPLDWEGQGDRAGQGRRTLRDTINRAYERLSTPEKRVFRRLAVLQGPFSQDATTMWAPHAPPHESELQHLVKVSLIERLSDDGGPTRYRMLEPFRAFACDLLNREKELDEARGHHAAFFLAKVTNAERQLRSGGRQPFLEDLERSHDDIRIAITWSGSERHNPELAQRLVGSMVWFWNFRGFLVEGRRWTNAASSWGRPGGLDEGKVLYGAGTFAFLLGDLPAAAELLELSAARMSGDDGQTVKGYSLTVLAMTRLFLGRGEEAGLAANEAESLFRMNDDNWGLALALNDLANVLLGSRDISPGDPAESRIQESIRLWEDLDDPWGRSLALTTRGDISLCIGDIPGAERALNDALALQNKGGDKWGQAVALMFLGFSRVLTGDLLRARDHLRESWSLNLALGRGQIQASCLEGFGCLAGAAGQPVLAAQLFGAADNRRSTFGVVLPEGERLRYERRVGQACGPQSAACHDARAEGSRWSLRRVQEEIDNLCARITS